MISSLAVASLLASPSSITSASDVASPPRVVIASEKGSVATTQPDIDIATQLKMLADMHFTGALSDEEFTVAKTRLLSS
jgi:hypothetical protein